MTTYKLLAQAAQVANDKHQAAVVKVMNELRALDSELVDKALHVIGSPPATANWLAATSSPLGGKTPLQALANGQRDEVLRLLAAIEYGIVV